MRLNRAIRTLSSRPPSSATPKCLRSGKVTALRASTDKSTSSLVIPERVRLNGVLLWPGKQRREVDGQMVRIVYSCPWTRHRNLPTHTATKTYA